MLSWLNAKKKVVEMNKSQISGIFSLSPKLIIVPPLELVFAFFLVSILQPVKKETKLMWEGSPADVIENP